MNALTPIGFRRDGTPIWPIAGGAGDDEDGEGAGGAQGAADGGEGSGGSEGGEGSGEGSGDGQGEGGDGSPSPPEQQAQEAIDELKQAGQQVPKALEDAVKEFRSARREAANYRTQSKEQQQQQAEAMKGLAKAFGIDVGDDDPPDPAELQKQISQSQDSERQARVELAAYKAAGKHDADADALLDSRSFLDQVAKLDPTADDFASQLDAAVKASVEANPKLKATPGGGQNNGRGPAQGPQPSGTNTRPQNLREALAARQQQ